MGLLPFLRLVIKLRHGPTKMHSLKAGAMSQRKEVFHLGGNDNIAAARLVQILNEFSGKVAGVSQKTNPRSCDLRRNLFQASLDHESRSGVAGQIARAKRTVDRKSTRLNSSHGYISYA